MPFTMYLCSIIAGKTCQKNGDTCRNDIECCGKVCQMEAPTGSTISNITSYCVSKDIGTINAQN